MRPWHLRRLIMLADQPTVGVTLLEALLAAWSPPELPIAATAYGVNGGVPAIFDRAFFPELKTLDHERGARDLIAREKKRNAWVGPDRPLTDIDTSENYARHFEQCMERRGVNHPP